MAKLYFYYSAMNAGKSTVLLQSSYNYRERGMRTLLFTPAIDHRAGTGRIESRIGLRASATALQTSDNLFNRVRAEHTTNPVACVLIDEAQFLTSDQVWQAADVADTLEIPVLCYGLRTDFKGNLFPGSATLLALADDLTELKTICHCGRKATMNLRIDATGHAVRDGAQVEIGGNDRYVAMCRRHFKDALTGDAVAPHAAPLPQSASPFPRPA
jgi:thymidine kinase